MLIPFGLSAQNEFKQIPKDKQYHSYAGIGIATSVILANKFIIKREMNPIAPTLAALTIGAGKEFYDSFNGGRFSGKDLLYTTASAAIINVVLGILIKPNKKHKEEINDPFDLINDDLVKK